MLNSQPRLTYFTFQNSCVMPRVLFRRSKPNTDSPSLRSHSKDKSVRFWFKPPFCEKQQTLLIFPHRGSKYIVWSVILQRVLTSRHSELLTALCGTFFSCNCSLSSRSIAQCVYIIIIVIGVLFVHQPSANHAPRASVTQVNHSAHTLSTFLRICADPSLQSFEYLSQWLLVILSLRFPPSHSLHVPSAPTTTGITTVFISHILCIFSSRSLHLLFFFFSFRATFQSDGTVISISL